MKTTIPIGEGIADLFGTDDSNIKYLESMLDVEVGLGEKNLSVEGDEGRVALAEHLIEDYAALRSEGVKLSDQDLKSVIRIVSEDNTVTLRQLVQVPRKVQVGNRNVAPKSLNQKIYIDAIERYDMVFGIGPAGTGKTYLAVSMAVRELLNKRVSRIVLTRPAVEAGERLGFLPGTMEEKVNPYLRPLYDALYDMLGQERVERYLERRVIEAAPIAFMRGRTLSDAFVILDEAQNTTSEQMKMFLTRIGCSSKAVINGDVTQIDLPFGKRSGLVEARCVLSGVDEIAFVTFNDRDVVRHPLVGEILRAYQNFDEASGTQATLHFRAPESESVESGELEAN